MGTLLNRRRYMGGGSSDEIIMTSITNPEVLAVCYAQGWCADANYMTKSEAEAVTDIGTAFQSNTSITHFEELKYFGITRLNNNAFNGCNKLVTMEVPTLTFIGNDSFTGCTSLLALDFPDSLTAIGYRAFMNCSGMTSLTVRSINPPHVYNAAAFFNTSFIIYVPSESVETYKVTVNWQAVASRIQAIPT